MLTRVTDTIVEELIVSICGEQPDARSRHLYSKALLGLVRVAKAEQMLQVKMDVERATGSSPSQGALEQTRAFLRKLGVELKNMEDEWPRA